jgi:hypothetical protein
MQVKRISATSLEVEKLPDGSTAIFNPFSKTVYSLNATSAAAWEACESATTLVHVTEFMQRSFNPGITEEIALEAIMQLQEQGLAEIAVPPAALTRRSALATAAGVMAPLVLALTSTEQRAFALAAGSGTTTTRPPE